jgi:hypothetical protein
MKSLVKTQRLVIRLSRREALDVVRAAEGESRRRGELVGAATLMRELAMPHVRELLAATDVPAATPAA